MFKRLVSFSALPVKPIASFLLFSLMAGGVLGGSAQAQEKTFTNSIGMEFVLIPPGQLSHYVYTTKPVRNDFDEVIQPATEHHQVITISRPFYLGKYEVTQEQWVAVMGEGSNPSRFKGRTNPVEKVSWDDTQKFIQKLNEKEGGNKYRLPTEAEWEHAARAGTKTKYFFGDNMKDLDEYAWFGENSGGTTKPVGQKKPNPWGLYDIYGNVDEWVQDWYGRELGEGWHKEGSVTDPTGPSQGSDRVARGCGWSYGAMTCESGFRHAPGNRNESLGFRLAFSPGL